MKKKVKDKPLTLDALVHYHQKVLIPDLEERFVIKKEFEKFKDESLSNQDAMLKKLNILLEEKKVRDYQREKEKKM